ncbi:MAG: hypothetical protein HQM10_01685 [Candidatus Riflebacteria bacterium]|nr:hypothetical protein [Candidatus Riflebacteria bacterium]
MKKLIILSLAFLVVFLSTVSANPFDDKASVWDLGLATVPNYLTIQSDYALIEKTKSANNIDDFISLAEKCYDPLNADKILVLAAKVAKSETDFHKLYERCYSHSAKQVIIDMATDYEISPILNPASKKTDTASNAPKDIPCIHAYYICKDTAVKMPPTMSASEAANVKVKMMNTKNLDEAIKMARKADDSKRDAYLYYAFYQSKNGYDAVRLASNALSFENKDAFLKAGAYDANSVSEIFALANAASSDESRKYILNQGVLKFGNRIHSEWDRYKSMSKFVHSVIFQ